MSCKATKTDTGADSSRPQKRQVLAMRLLCDLWYSATSLLPKPPLPVASSSAKLLCGPDTCNLTVAWFPPPSGLMELRIHRLIRSFKIMTSYHVYDGQIFTELCCCLAVLSMYRDIQGLRQFVRCWNPATHTFFLAWGEVTITLEDIERILLLPCLGDNDPTTINLTVEETKWEDTLYLGFGGREASLGGQKARLNYWIQHFQNHHTCWVRRSAFVVYLLSRLHNDEVEGSPYHAVESLVNIALLQVFVMEHIRSFASHAKTSKVVRDRVLRSLGDGKDVPSANVVVFDCDSVMAPFIIIRASKYWSDLSVRVTIPAGMRVGNLTSHMYRCEEAESTLLAMPLKQGKALNMREPVVAPEISPKKNQTSCKKRKTVALAISSTNGEGSNKKARENDDTNPHSRILGKAKASNSADLRKSKQVVLAIHVAPVGSDVMASSPIVIDEGPSDPVSQALPSPSTSEERVYIPEEVPLSMALLATTDIPKSSAHSQENDVNMLPQIDTVANVFTTAIVEKVTDNTRSSEVDLVIQRCGETPHGISSHLVVGVVALGNTHPCHLNFGLNETQANLRIASHFWSFSEAKENFLHFSVPIEVAPLLEKLLLKHGNFVDGFKLGTGFGDFSLALLAAVLMDIHHIPFDLLGEGKLFEWMVAVRDLMTTGVVVEREMWFA
uniref:Aminotransferase-like plant mobile domain-containing protein n=1 Tax=Fagus sylvatica TaxID=28930 RepID=A0A2N9FRT1_FAGSY